MYFFLYICTLKQYVKMYTMKRIFVALMAVALMFGAAGDLQAQNKKKK